MAPIQYNNYDYDDYYDTFTNVYEDPPGYIYSARL